MDSDDGILRVLLIDDDAGSRTPDGGGAQIGNTRLDTVGIAEIANSDLNTRDYDMVLISPAVSNEIARDVVRQFRQAGSGTPIVVLPVAAIDSTKILSGADQVLAALSDKIRLFARLQLILRQSRGLSRSVLRAGPLTFDFDKREITVNGKRIRLSDSLYSVLELLAIHNGRLVTRDMIAERLYGQVNGPSPKVIDIFICKLRQRLARLGADNLIHTVWGRGYVMRDQDDANTEADTMVRDREKAVAAQNCAEFR